MFSFSSIVTTYKHFSILLLVGVVAKLYRYGRSRCDFFTRNLLERMELCCSDFEAPSIPDRPIIDPAQNIAFSIEIIQKYVSAFEYNHTGATFIKLKKTGGTLHMKEVVDKITTYGVPIQCVEAVFIAGVLTAGWENVFRFPISFKSKYETHIHRHIVLAIYSEGRWGAIGISRRQNLMYKPFIYSSLWELIEEYQDSYESVLHKLQEVYIGQPLPTQFIEDEKIIWKDTTLKMEKKQLSISRQQVTHYLQKYHIPQ